MKGTVFRVFGPELGEGACVRAASEGDAISLTARILGLDQNLMAAAAEAKVQIPEDMILLSSGQTIRVEAQRKNKGGE